jgi:PAS domain S-box-containing protein
VGSLVMASGIAAMHYIGTAAMRGMEVTTYDSRVVGLSIALAVVIAFVALKLVFRVRGEVHTNARKVMSAVVMGSAISMMHYAGMWAASFHPSTNAVDLTRSIGVSTIGIAAITGSRIFILTGAILVSFFDRYLTLHKGDLQAARESELYFHTMAEAVPEIIWTADADGRDDFFNQKSLEYMGLTSQQMSGDGWKVIIHPDDLDDCQASGRKLCGTEIFTRWSTGFGERREAIVASSYAQDRCETRKRKFLNGLARATTFKTKNTTSRF